MWFIWSNMEVCMLDIFYLTYWHLGFLFNIDDVAKLYCVNGPLGPFSSLLLALYFISYAYDDPIRERFLFKFSRELPEAYRGKIILPQDTVYLLWWNTENWGHVNTEVILLWPQILHNFYMIELSFSFNSLWIILTRVQ